ncbi:CHAT domain-containing tetratricopeptide repeat protein [Laspinema sp. A4]|uniref:CHAT domain-containing protein n=1 Tax=Laspinema sp. D2d TaxID=2953686 RepID=UPI0021BAF0BA|nr:CHAT domain-containing tetratricopeptide repeat protein [Laspinema sp. D2d]MCT7985062.1 CHAT domain-containing tetratricopeptide repeat protein [Laspinema sp. D2d]
MLGKLWRWLKSTVARWWGGGRTAAPPPPPQMNPLSDTQYEQVFLKLLDGVALGWDSGRVLDYLGERVDDRFFHNWLMRFGRDRLLGSPRPHRELASRMVRLGELGSGKIGELAHQYGAQKLAQPLSPLTEAEFESLFPELLQQRHQGCEAVLEWLQELEPRAQERDWLDWLEKAGETWLANPPEARFVQALQEFGNLGALPLAQRVGDLGQQLQERLRVSSPHPLPPGTGGMTSPVAHPGGTGGSSVEAGGSQVSLTFENPEAEAAFGRIVELFNAGDDEAALMLANEAIESFPDEWVLWGIQGDVLGNLGRYEEAVASYDRALELNPKYPIAWSARGYVLGNLGRYEESVASDDRALALNPKYADGWSNRGITLSELGRDEEAVASYNRALELNPNLAKGWGSRGISLVNLGRYEEAVASYDRALELNPNLAEGWTNRGNALYNLGRHEEAVASHDHALDLNPNNAIVWVNRGSAAGNSPGCFYSVTLTLPPHLQNPALDQRGYEGELASYEEGLKYCLPDRDPQGAGWLNYNIGSVHYFRGRRDANPYPFWRKAVTRYNAALDTLSETHSPELRLKALRDLSRVLFELGQREEAAEVRRQGSDLLRCLIQQSPSPGKQRLLALEFISFQQLTVDLECQAGHPVSALMLAEQGKNSCLRWWLSGWMEEIPSPDFPSLQQYLCREKTAAVYWHISPAALTTFLLKPNQDPIPLLASEESDAPFPRLQQLLAWEKWVDTWKQDYQDYRSGKSKSGSPKRDHPWRQQMDSRLQQLGEILRIEALLAELAHEEIDHLILLPHRDLHLFPLEALFPPHYSLIRLPSAQVGMTLAQQPVPPITSEAPLLLVGDPESQGFPRLDFAAFETESLGRRFQRVQPLCGPQVRQESLKDELVKGEYRLMHFTGHGGYDFDAPDQSWLALSGKEFLRVRELLNLPLSGYRLVSLAACETAMTGQKSITTDYVGLSSGWLMAGVSLVLSTLWRVDDPASMLLTLKFYDLVLAGVPEPQALAEAKRWLSHCDVAGLRQFYEAEQERYGADNRRVRPFFLDQLDFLEGQDPQAQLYAHPYYWAAFTLTGDTKL